MSLAAALLLVALYSMARPATLQAAWAELARLIELKSEPLPASPARLSEHQIEELERSSPQEQAELLVQRAVNHYEGAIELVASHVDGWRGNLTLSPQLSAALKMAIDSNDLRVRAAAIEVYLASSNLTKTPESAQQLVRRIENEPDARNWGLWMLGALGNRGVERELAQQTLLFYRRDASEETRRWAVEGLGLLGDDAIVEPLLETFRDDPSMNVRERAACNLAQSGMLTKQQRMAAVPMLLNYAEDPSFDAVTRRWVFQALKDITGATIGPDPAAWRAWWAEHAPR